MRPILLALLLAGAALTIGPRTTSYAQSTDNTECQQRLQQLAGPIVDEMLWFAHQTTAYPLTPDGRPVVTGWPYSAFGPGDGYGPGSPYGPWFGPWGVGSFGPGFGGPGGYGLSPLGLGGPPWQLAAAAANGGVANLVNGPPGLGVATVANGLAAGPGGLVPVGGLGGPNTANLIALAALNQTALGNALAGTSLSQSILGNTLTEASLRQAVVANRLAAGQLSATLGAYASGRANDLGVVVSALQAYVSGTCGGGSGGETSSTPGSERSGGGAAGTTPAPSGAGQ
ncbi:MAG TPA: hypothetical protein VK066_26720 [Chloroflexota bacterium]|nr:hypothetical protein [Chloroflexota bacterium]